MGMKIPVVFFMPSALREALWFLCALLLVSTGRADVLVYNTGTASTDYSNTGGAVGKLNSNLYSRGQSFTNTQGPCTITHISVWLSTTVSLSGTFNLSLFSSSGTPGTNAIPFNTTQSPLFTTGPINANGLGLGSTAILYDFTNLNWSLDGSASTYFFVFDARNMASGSDNYFLWQNSVPAVSGQNSADSTNFSTWSHLSSTGAAQVYAVVPEPGTWMLLSLAFSMAGAVIGFRAVRRRLFFFTFSRGY
jgi:hypothetical protein